jgi:hypothetical protein
MAHSWYYRSRGQLSGPIDFAELAQLAAGGALQPGDELRQGEHGDWVPAASVVGLFPEPEELHDLADLQFQFVESTPARVGAFAGSDQVATLDDLNIRVVSEPAATRKAGPRPPANSGSPATVAVDEPETEGWYYQSLGQNLGPMPFGELVRLAQDGVISHDDMVRRGQSGAWQRAVRVEELASEFPPADAVVKTTNRIARNIPPSPPAAPVKSPPDQPDEVADDDPVDDVGPDLPAPPAPPEPSDRWFCRIDDIEHGPLTRDELAGMARHNRIKPETQVKEGDDGVWTAAAAVDGLFAATETAAPAAAAALASAAATPAGYVAPKRTKEKKKRKKRPRGPREPLLPRLKEIVANNKPVVFGALGLAVVVAVVLFFALGRSGSEGEHYDRLKGILDEHYALKKRKAKQSDWAPLVEKATALKAEIYPYLEKNASSKKPELQELLWASQDMIPMLSKGPSTPNDHERRFVGHLKAAARLLSKPANFGDSVEAKQTAATSSGI